MTNNIHLVLDGNSIEVKNCLIGGRMVDTTDTPFAVYCGNTDISEVALSMLHIMRATIKLIRNEYHMSTEASQDFLNFISVEAIRLEREHAAELETGDSVETFVKRYMDNQF